VKKVLSIILVITILISTVLTSIIVSANNTDSNIKTTVVDLTQSLTNVFATTGSTTATTATVEGGKLKVNVSAYERQLAGETSYSKQTWYPNYLLATNDVTLHLTNGSRAIVEVKYKITGTPNVNHGTQIGIGNWAYGKGSNIYVRNSKKHVAGDEGKEFTLAASYTVDNNTAIKIAFSGGGKIEISSIVVHELPAEYINDYAIVKYVDGESESTEFVKKNSAPKKPIDEENFYGWYVSNTFAGEAVNTVTADVTLYAKRSNSDVIVDNIIKTTVINLSQDTGNIFATTGSTTATTATVEGGKLKVNVSAYERQLAGETSYSKQTWYPNYLLAANGSTLHLKNGSRAIVEVKYKITGTPNVNHGTQIGIGNWVGGKGSNIYVRNSKKHVAGDEGKEFTLAANYTVDNNTAIKIAFSGGGKIEISSIVVHELPAEYINDYAIVKYVDGESESTEFVKKNSELKKPLDEEKFEGWYLSSTFAGEAVTTVTADATLYAKRSNSAPIIDKRIKTTVIDLSQDTTNIFATTGSTEATTATVEDGKLKVNVSAYERQLAGETSYSKQTWYPNYLLAANGVVLHLTNGSRAIVEVKYKVTGAPNVNHGTQIGIGNWVGGKGSNIYVRSSKKHVAGDEGKEFTLAASYTVDKNTAIKIAFSGGGKIEISSIVVHELPAEYINDYVIVKYIDGTEESNEFVNKNSGLKAPVKEYLAFDGWYTDKTYSGEAVTGVDSDITLYAKWKPEDGYGVINFHDGSSVETKKYVAGDNIDVTPEKNGFNFLGWYKNLKFIGRPVTVAEEGVMDLYAKWEEINPKVEQEVDLTKNQTLVTTSKSADSKVTLKNNKLIFDIHNYERQLNKTDTSNADSWFPGYYFMDSNGDKVEFIIGENYELTVEYKVVDVKAGDNVGLQIGFGADGQSGQTRTRIKGYAMHTASDEGKKFSYTTTYTAEKFNFGQTHLPKLLFSGQGELEVLSIKVKKILSVIKDTVIGEQTYEDYEIGIESGVLGNKKGVEVSKNANHTSGLFKKKSLQLDLNTTYLRLSANTVISFKNSEGEFKPYVAEKGGAYRVTFYLYATQDMDNLHWSVNSVDEAKKNDYFSFFRMENDGKVSLKKGKWKKITAYIPVLKGCESSKNLIALAVASEEYDGKSVYVDDVKIEQLVDSEVVIYDTMGDTELEPQRAFKGEKYLSFKEPSRTGYLFDGWFYDAEYKNEAKPYDKFPQDKSEIILYAKWVEEPTNSYNFNAGSFDKDIFNNGVEPYENTVEDMDSDIDGKNNKSMTQNVAWVKDAGIYGNGTSENDGAIAFINNLYSSYMDKAGYNITKLINKDGTPFTVVKGERYTIEFDYIFASHKGLSYIIPIISECSAYADFGKDSFQTIGKVSVMETDTDYLHYKQSFVAERTGYFYLALTGRDDNANVDTHCYEKVYVDNLKVNKNSDVTKLVIKQDNNIWYTTYGIKGEKLILPNAVKQGTDTFDGFYLDPEFKTKFNGYYPENDATIYIKLKKDKYDKPSDFSKPIVIDFEETELLTDFYRQQKYMTSWSREVQNEWIFVTNDSKNALKGKNYIKLNGFSHYWNQAKFVLYDPDHTENVMLLDKDGKYRVKVMVRCEDTYESPVNMTICLENPAKQHLLEENGSVKLEYDPTGDKDGYFMFVGDIEVRADMEYYPSLAIRRNANDLQSIFIDTVSVEKLRDCTIKFEENGGTPIEDAVVQIHDLLYDPGVPYKEGYVLDGWYIDSKFSKKWDFENDTVEDDMTLYAKWSVEVIENEPNEDSTEDNQQNDKPTEETKPQTDSQQNDETDNSEIQEDFDEDDVTVDDSGEFEEISNGAPPSLLDADKVVLNVEDDIQQNNNRLPLLAIILICIGSALVVGAGVFVSVIFIRKKAKKKV